MTAPDPRFVRRARSDRRRRRLRVLSWMLIGVAPLGLATWLLYSPALDVDGVRVQGTVRLTQARVLAVAGIERGAPMFRVDETAVRRRLGEISVVKDVYVDRAWPNRVVITVVERDPVVGVNTANGIGLYDIDGVYVATQAAPPANLPVLSIDGGVPAPDALRAVISVVRALPVELRARVAAFAVGSADDVRFRLRDGATVAWGNAEESATKAAALERLLRPGARHYDLRAPANPAVS